MVTPGSQVGRDIWRRIASRQRREGGARGPMPHHPFNPAHEGFCLVREKAPEIDDLSKSATGNFPVGPREGWGKLMVWEGGAEGSEFLFTAHGLQERRGRNTERSDIAT